MSKKNLHYNEAEQLFVVEGYSLEMISSQTGVSTRTLQEWKAEGTWEAKRTELRRITNNTGEQATSIAAKILKRILDKIDNDEELIPTEILFVKEFLPSRNKIKTPEEAAADKQPVSKSTGVSENTLAKFRKFMGLKS